MFFFLDPVPKGDMPGILKSVDIALVPLRKLDIFQGAIPSKVFEALAMEIPLLLGVDGEAREHFITRAKAGVYFEPENLDDLCTKMEHMILNIEERLNFGKNGRTYVQEHFNRNKIATRFIDLLKEL